MNRNFDCVSYKINVRLLAQMLPLLKFTVLNSLHTFHKINRALIRSILLVVVRIAAFNHIGLIFLEHN